MKLIAAAVSLLAATVVADEWTIWELYCGETVSPSYPTRSTFHLQRLIENSATAPLSLLQVT